MKTKDLERLVAGVVDMKPHRFIDRSKSVELINDNPSLTKKHSKSKEPKKVNGLSMAQPVAQKREHLVAQGTWVAQTVAQSKQQKVAQNKKDKVQSLVAKNEVEAIKIKIAEMATTEERKNYLKSIGINIKVERRSKSYYLYGIKKVDGKKERFYAGSVLSL